MSNEINFFLRLEKHFFPSEQKCVMKLLELFPTMRPILKDENDKERIYRVTSAKISEKAENLRIIVKNSYNTIGINYLHTRSSTSNDIKLLQELIKRLPKGSKVLDAGCGPGFPITYILNKHFKVIGVDFSEKQLDLAREIVPSATFYFQDITKLTFEENEFDGICCYYALVHIPREEHLAILKNFYRILKPGGLALLCLGAYNMPDIKYNYLGHEMLWSHYDDITNLKILEQCGFKIQHSTIIGKNTLAAHLFVLGEK